MFNRLCRTKQYLLVVASSPPTLPTLSSTYYIYSPPQHSFSPPASAQPASTDLRGSIAIAGSLRCHSCQKLLSWASLWQLLPGRSASTVCQDGELELEGPIRSVRKTCLPAPFLSFLGKHSKRSVPITPLFCCHVALFTMPPFMNESPYSEASIQVL